MRKASDSLSFTMVVTDHLSGGWVCPQNDDKLLDSASTPEIGEAEINTVPFLDPHLYMQTLMVADGFTY